MTQWQACVCQTRLCDVKARLVLALPESVLGRAQVVSFKRRSYAEVSRVFGPTIRRRFEQQQLKELWWTT